MASAEREPMTGLGAEPPVGSRALTASGGYGTPRREAKVAISESNWSPFPTVFFLIGFG